MIISDHFLWNLKQLMIIVTIFVPTQVLADTIGKGMNSETIQLYKLHAFVSVHAYVLVYLCFHKIFNTLISIRNTILNKSKTYLMINLEFVKLYVSDLHSYMKLEIKNLVLSSLIICYKKLIFF